MRVFHATPAGNAESILASGLQAVDSADNLYTLHPHGIYVSKFAAGAVRIITDIAEARGERWEFELLTIELPNDVPVERDPTAPEHSLCVLLDVIPPFWITDVKRVGKLEMVWALAFRGNEILRERQARRQPSRSSIDKW